MYIIGQQGCGWIKSLQPENDINFTLIPKRSTSHWVLLHNNYINWPAWVVNKQLKTQFLFEDISLQCFQLREHLPQPFWFAKTWPNSTGPHLKVHLVFSVFTFTILYVGLLEWDSYFLIDLHLDTLAERENLSVPVSAGWTFGIHSSGFRFRRNQYC